MGAEVASLKDKMLLRLEGGPCLINSNLLIRYRPCRWLQQSLQTDYSHPIGTFVQRDRENEDQGGIDVDLSWLIDVLRSYLRGLVRVLSNE